MPAERTRSSGHPRSWLVCHVCDESFKRAEHLTRHVRKHTGEKPFSCPSCRKSFNRPDSLKRHEQLHTPQNGSKDSAAADAPMPTPLSNLVESDGLDVASTVLAAGPMQHSDHPQQQPTDPSQWATQPLQPIDPSGASGSNPDFFGRNMDPSVMSNTNWLPLESGDWDWNVFNIFLDSSFSETAQAMPAAAFDPASASSFAAQSPSESMTSRSIATSDLDPNAATYVDSGVTRLAKGRKRTTSIHRGPEKLSKSRYGFPVQADTGAFDFTPDFVSKDSYEAIYNAFTRTCTDTQSAFEPYMSLNFPSLEDLDSLVGLAVEHFLPSLPIINKSFLREQKCSWILCLALSAIGARYEVDISEIKAWSLIELLRRVILISGEAFVVQTSDLELVQSKLLLCISLLYSGRTSYSEKGRVAMGDIARFSVQQVDIATNAASPRSPMDLESRIRTKHAIWLLDCMSAYQHDMRPVLSLEDAETPMPISDSLWDSASGPAPLRDAQVGATPSLGTAVRDLYFEKKVHPAIGEFGRILLIHALFHQTWHVAKTCRSSLSSWEPQARSLNLSPLTMAHVEPNSEEWAPVNPTFSRWRNAACDCIDVLHWHANSQIGANSGQEHPTVLFLHLSRVVLLSPMARVREVVAGLVGDQPMTRAQAESAVREIFRWAHEDCYKARLAQIHAGVLLYHIRRHSLDSFYEPPAVFAAILCLWAYGCTHQQSMSRAVSRAETPEEQSPGDCLPSFIHLDRPCDDELVQMFITNGNRIVPNVTGVGDICAVGGPKKILKLGCTLLSYAKNWDLPGRYASVLGRLQAKTNVFQAACENS